MSNSATVNFRNSAFIREAGMTALKKELGTVGATYFIRQFNTGQGDYTNERDQLFKELTLDDLIKEVQEIDTLVTADRAKKLGGEA